MTAVEAQAEAVKSINDIPGWFPGTDQLVFGHFLSPDAVVPRGDLVELGVYLGKSAAFMGRFKAPDETFTVCDLFGMAAGDESNQAENRKSYSTLDREKFERNYLALFDELPVIVQDLSSAIVDRVRAASSRFVHVDASHLYEHVAVDVESARTMLVPDGVVVFDDFRSAHTPGVSAAVWEAVFNRGLHPICVTVQKLYATFGDPGPHQDRMRAWFERTGEVTGVTDIIAGAPVLRVWAVEVPKPAAAKNAPAQNPAAKNGTPTAGKPAAPAAKVERRLVLLERKVAGLEARAAARPKPSIARRLVRKVRRAQRAQQARRAIRSAAR